MDPRGFPTSLPEFQAVFPTDEACAAYLEKLRWPGGFTCPKCGQTGEPYRFTNRPGVLRCRACKADVSLTAGTSMQGTHTSLSTWFWGAYLVTTQTPGQSALQFQRQLAIGRYETAFQLLHKLRAGMVRPEREMIGGERLRQRVEALAGSTFNSVLCNLYRDGTDCVGYHADDEPVFGGDPIVASVSFGASRNFKLRRNDKKGKREFLLEDGMLFIMGRGVQRDWKHSIPKTTKPCGERINLTFRLTV